MIKDYYDHYSTGVSAFSVPKVMVQPFFFSNPKAVVTALAELIHVKRFPLPQICVWPSTSPSRRPPSWWSRRARTSRSPVSCPSGAAMPPCPWSNGPSSGQDQMGPGMNSSLLASIWGRHVSTAITQRASHGPKWSWQWWSRGRSLTSLSWTCPRVTRGSTCAGFRSLRSTRTAGRPRQTAPPLLNSEVRPILTASFKFDFPHHRKGLAGQLKWKPFENINHS